VHAHTHVCTHTVNVFTHRRLSNPTYHMKHHSIPHENYIVFIVYYIVYLVLNHPLLYWSSGLFAYVFFWLKQLYHHHHHYRLINQVMQNAPTARVWYRESKYCSAERNWGPEREGNTRKETSKYRHTASSAPRESAAITYSGLAKATSRKPYPWWNRDYFLVSHKKQ